MEYKKKEPDTSVWDNSLVARVERNERMIATIFTMLGADDNAEIEDRQD